MRPLPPAALILLALATAIPSASAGDGAERQPRGGAPLIRQIPPALVAPASLAPRQEMRRFIERIAAAARRRDPDFIVVAQGGLPLIDAEPGDDGEPRTLARPYVGLLDGVLVEGLTYGLPAFGAPTEDNARRLPLDQAQRARAAGLTVLVIDYAEDSAAIGDAFARNKQLGFVSLAAAAPAARLAALPAFPARPFDENAVSIRTLKDVRNFAYLADLAGRGGSEELAAELGETNHDLLIVDAFVGRQPLTPAAVQSLKYKRLGSRRLVLARLDLGFAAGHRYYWQAGWRAGSPSWIEAALPGETERHPVRYWHPDWQQIIAGEGGSYLEGVMGLGFDGVVLAGVDAYRRFEGDDPPTAMPWPAPSLPAAATRL
jgi:endo-alpha-1,4-polygalactosaminidase (GH114 family)